MAGQIWSKGGDAWQQYILCVLRHRHRPPNDAFQEVPDTDKGDLGLEGFSKTGCVYQCYAADEPMSTSVLYEKQRDKITVDIGKFKSNKSRLEIMFGTIKIEQWVLIVPRFESAKLVSHASRKSAEVRSANLPYTHPSFTIQVHTQEDYLAEVNAIYGTGLQRLCIGAQPVADSDVLDWQNQNDDLVGRLDDKLAKIQFSAEGQLPKFRQKILNHYLTGQKTYRDMHRDYPELFLKLETAKQGRERILSTMSLVATGPAQQTLKEAISEFTDDLREALPGLDRDTHNVIVMESVADWLLRCPLDF